MIRNEQEMFENMERRLERKQEEILMGFEEKALPEDILDSLILEGILQYSKHSKWSKRNGL